MPDNIYPLISKIRTCTVGASMFFFVIILGFIGYAVGLLLNYKRKTDVQDNISTFVSDAPENISTLISNVPDSISDLIFKMKTYTIGAAVSFAVMILGFIGYSVGSLLNYKICIPFPITVTAYSILVIAAVFALLNVINIIKYLSGDKSVDLKKSLKALNIAYIIMSFLSAYAVIVLGY